MSDFRQDGGKRFGGGGRRGGFGGRDGGQSGFRKNWDKSGGRDRGPVTMHQAICDQCGKPCEVPFRPTDGKPVYCNICFGAKKGAGDDRRGDRFSQGNPNSYQNTTRPDFGRDFSRGNTDDLKRQMDVLNSKMDRLIKLVEGAKDPKPASDKPVKPEENTKKASKTVPEVKVVPAAKAKKSSKKDSKKKKR